MTEHSIPTLKFRVCLFLIAAGFLVLVEPSVMGQVGAAAAQAPESPASVPYVPTMTFDVTSVRENKDINLNAGYMMGGQFMGKTATYRATNMLIDGLISTAFDVMEYQIVGAPKWPWPTFFMVEAKGSSEADAKLAALPWKQREAEQEHMLQGLLAERFKMKAHWETREGDVYNLVVAKGGSRMGAAGSLALSAEEKERFGDHPVPPLSQTGCDAHGCTYVGHGCTVAQIVGILPGELRGQVFDKTGLTGKYDFVLKYMGGKIQDRPADDMNPTPPMDRALEDQLGLKVETGKGPVKVLVIDHIEKPSEN